MANYSIDNIDNKWNSIRAKIDDYNNSKILTFEEKKNTIIDNENDCIFCGNKNSITVDNKSSYKVCIKCGSISKALIDDSPDKLKYNNDEQVKSRCIYNPNSDYFKKSAQKIKISGGYGNKMINKMESWMNSDYTERGIMKVHMIFNEICTKYNIMNCVNDDAKSLYKQICDYQSESENKKGKNILFRSGNKKGLLGSLFYEASKRMNMPLSFYDISYMFDVSNEKLCKTHTKTIFILDRLGVQRNDAAEVAHLYASSYCNRLKLKDAIIAQAVKISKNISRLYLLESQTEVTKSAIAIYTVAVLNKLKLTDETIANMHGINKTTIKKIYHELVAIHKNIFLILNSNKITKKLIERHHKKYSNN